MKIIEKKIKFCRLCQSKKLKKIYQFYKSPIGDDYQKFKKKVRLFKLIVLKCRNCKFVQLSNVINPNKVYGDYIYVSQTSHGLSDHFKNLVKYLKKKKYLNSISQVMEIGSNDGTLLKILENDSYFSVGVDPATHLTKEKNLICEKGMYNYNFSKKIKSKYYSFDLIIANNVIANIDNLKNVFKGISNNLNNDGYFVMETFSLSKLLQNNLIDNIYHEHLSYFTFKNLKLFAKNFNLHLIDGDFLKVKGGSLRLIFKKTNKPIKIKKVENIIKKEQKNLKIDFTFRKLRVINNLNAKKIHEYIDNNKNKNFYGFGASVGTTTLIYDFNLKKKIKIIFDNEIKRSGLFVPNTDIIVKYPSGKIKKNSVIIVFAWRYFKNIIKKNKNFFQKDTKFILPLPKFKIIGNL